MTISGDYAQPVQVNGFTCHNCTEVDLAKRNVDPAHPRSGPSNIDAAEDPSRNQVVSFGGALAGAAQGQGGGSSSQGDQPGRRLNVLL